MASLHGWRHCPRCAAALEQQVGRASCLACGFVAYASSSPCTCALVADAGGRLLLARRAVEPYRGRWDVPGGFLEEHELPLDGLRRELREETGLEVEPLEFAGAWVDRYGEGPDAGSTLNLCWHARVLAGEARPADDVAELAWFAADELPDAKELAFSRLPDVLAAWRRRPGT